MQELDQKDTHPFCRRIGPFSSTHVSQCAKTKVGSDLETEALPVRESPPDFARFYDNCGKNCDPNEGKFQPPFDQL